MRLTASEVFRRAADYLEKHGWLQDDFGEIGGPCCVVGAMQAVKGHAPGAPHRGDERWGVKREVDVLSRYLDTNPEPWNDRNGRTKDEVVAALRKAARTRP